MFTQGFKKVAALLPRTLAQAGRALTSNSALKGAGVGALSGAVSGAVNAPEGEGFSGALKGAALGGVVGAGTGAAARKYQAGQRLEAMKLKNPSFGAKPAPVAQATP